MAVRYLCFIVLALVAAPTLAQYKLYEKGHASYKAEKYPEAIGYLSEYLSKALRDKSIDAEVFYLRALSYYKTQDYKNAIPDFEETLLRGHPNKGNIYWFSAKSNLALNQLEESLNSYNQAIRELSGNKESKGKLLFERSLVYTQAGNATLAAEDIQAAYQLMPKDPLIKSEYEKLKGTALATRPAAQSESKASPSVPVGSQSVAPLSPLAELYKNEVRYALVIGNSEYPKEIGRLRNPVNDATDMAAELKNCNFQVQLLTNATYGQIRAALMRFKEKIDGSDHENTVGLFYYAGHGVRFENENFLVPVDAAVQYEDDIPRYCFPIQRMVLSNMESSSIRMNIIILDACRNNPFPKVNRSLGESGLGEMQRGKGSFVAYSTAPGSVTSDGTGRNGLYTQELLKTIRKPGLTIEQVFKEVRMNVLRLSNNQQNTWDSSNILGEFHFRY